MASVIKIASSEIGVKETPGSKTSLRILKYAKEAGFNNYVSDETAWCSLFVNWVAYKANLERSNSLSARSWLNVGFSVNQPEPGDVVVFWRESRDSWKGHVGFFNGISLDRTRVYCIGGNQGNQVSNTAKSIDRVLGYRRLRSVKKPRFSGNNLKKGDTGLKVIQLQNSLKQLGYDCGTSDGLYGSKTERAVKDFQSTNRSLTINGVFDKATRNMLIKQLLRK